MARHSFGSLVVLVPLGLALAAGCDLQPQLGNAPTATPSPSPANAASPSPTATVAPTEAPQSVAQVSTFVGDGSSDLRDGPVASAGMPAPYALAMDTSGTLYEAQRYQNTLRAISPDGTVTTLPGSGFAGYAEIGGIAVDAAGNLYSTDWANNRIRKRFPDGTVTTLAGGTAGFKDGTGADAQFSGPKGIAVDASGNVYVADLGNLRIRKITPAGVVTTLAGDGNFGHADGSGPSAQFYSPYALCVDPAGTLYATDGGWIRKITPDGGVSTVAGDGSNDFGDGTGTAARFNTPYGITVDRSGTLFVADTGNYRIRRISPTGVVTTVAGDGSLGSTDGPGPQASFRYPIGLALDASGSLYVADEQDNRIRQITF